MDEYNSWLQTGSFFLPAAIFRHDECMFPTGRSQARNAVDLLSRWSEYVACPVLVTDGGNRYCKPNVAKHLLTVAYGDATISTGKPLNQLKCSNIA